MSTALGIEYSWPSRPNNVVHSNCRWAFAMQRVQTKEREGSWSFYSQAPLSMHGGGAEPRKRSEKKVAKLQFRSVPIYVGGKEWWPFWFSQVNCLVSYIWHPIYNQGLLKPQNCCKIIFSIQCSNCTMKNRHSIGLWFQVFKKIRNESLSLLILVKFLIVKQNFLSCNFISHLQNLQINPLREIYSLQEENPACGSMPPCFWTWTSSPNLKLQNFVTLSHLSSWNWLLEQYSNIMYSSYVESP